jgi:LysM repeat protein
MAIRDAGVCDSGVGFSHALALAMLLSRAETMNMSNPFQIPSCLQRVNLQHRRRERFKRGFIVLVAAIVLLLVGLLIEGCQTERATAATPAGNASGLSAPQANPPLAVAQKPNSSPQPNLNATTRLASPVSKAEVAAAASHPQTLYVVKSGDTLIRIAKAYGVTVKALKAANGLKSDRIIVGAKLKIPEA